MPTPVHVPNTHLMKLHHHQLLLPQDKIQTCHLCTYTSSSIITSNQEGLRCIHKLLWVKLCSSPNSHVDTVLPNTECDYIWSRAFKEVIKVKVLRVGPTLIRLRSLRRGNLEMHKNTRVHRHREKMTI